MKHIENNLLNTIMFVHEGIDFSDATYLEFSQITTDFKKLVPVTFTEADCFVSKIDLDLFENYTPNGLYTISVLDSNKVYLASATCKVTGMTEGDKREYIIEDGAGTGPSKLEIPTNIKAEIEN